MDDFNWTCPHCERDVTISERRITIQEHTLSIDNADGRRTFISTFTVCPNPKCQKFTLVASLHESELVPGSRSMTSGTGPREDMKSEKQGWSLIPPSASKHFPDYVPKPIRDDYLEACLIRDLSPKASATLSRRCLQGIIRDFWRVNPGKLVKEIEQIEDQVDPVTWGAIEAVRTLGNIGAHMEKDINVIVDVDPNEASLLIGLVETLLHDWYVVREKRRNQMDAVIAAAAAKAPKKTP
jgi:hypothetical protein